MNSTNEINNDHEVRIRMLEIAIDKIDKRFDKLDIKIDSNFHWILGVMISFFITMIGIFGGVILHLGKLL